VSFYLFIQENVRGPYSEGELRDMLKHREVASHTPACPEGESEWSTVEACLGSQSPSPIPPSYPSGVPVVEPSPRTEERYSATTSFPRTQEPGPMRTEAIRQRGIGRALYFLCGLGISGLSKIMETALGNDPVTLGFTLILSLTIVVLRLQNIGKSVWWAPTILVPILNLYIGLLCLAAPAGYQVTRQFDAAGKTILWIFGGVVALFVYLMLTPILMR